ncbi:cobalamin biosynthesis protein CobD [Dehalococcoides mccartyi]|jgi:adenosylcobinamide-phosphate synthase|uniref:adenosylcobinamide-phosphate synthase CbiB n=1 Tax=Dehalococcoides mccartyi TaxID=61435 RepID=UPI00099BB0D7|nr:adenosylcobinamide-phosphate synthase CbiB [Dehalococcoides mccartyi]AQX74152.1 cobalamin biosynthesis protein CobD [Dehalococcoides mccartyi]AQY72666.1 cobalamin biosynthesis protein CobD [Dehalococcoides mccartyi]
MNEHILILVLAVLWDLALAEPPAAIHLTVWIGRMISVVEKTGLKMRSHALQYIFGMLVSLFLIALFGWLSYWLLAYLGGISFVIYIIAAFLLLKPTFCFKFNARMSLLVEKYLKGGDYRIESADKEIRYLLTTVEREKGDEFAPPMISSTIRSLSENASDFLVAPLFYFLILGVPGAVAYRVSNTLDGMLGHRGEYEYLGKFAACLDDILNYIPARLTGLMFVLSAFVSGLDGKNAWKMALRDQSKTESPNAGWPMAATAGALGVRLERAGHYALGDADKPLTAGHIGQAVRLFRVMSAIDIIGSIGILFLLSWVSLN